MENPPPSEDAKIGSIQFMFRGQPRSLVFWRGLRSQIPIGYGRTGRASVWGSAFSRLGAIGRWRWEVVIPESLNPPWEGSTLLSLRRGLDPQILSQILRVGGFFQCANGWISISQNRKFHPLKRLGCFKDRTGFWDNCSRGSVCAFPVLGLHDWAELARDEEVSAVFWPTLSSFNSPLYSSMTSVRESL